MIFFQFVPYHMHWTLVKGQSFAWEKYDFLKVISADSNKLRGASLPRIIIPLLRYFTIEGQEYAQNMPRYYTVKLCIALQNPRFTGVLAEGLILPNFDVIFPSGIINLLFDGLTYNTRGHFAHRSATRKISARIIC